MLCLLLLLKADVVCVFCINLHNRVTILCNIYHPEGEYLKGVGTVCRIMYCPLLFSCRFYTRIQL